MNPSNSIVGIEDWSTLVSCKHKISGDIFCTEPQKFFLKIALNPFIVHETIRIYGKTYVLCVKVEMEVTRSLFCAFMYNYYDLYTNITVFYKGSENAKYMH